jgi:hypothetical protein
MNAETIAAALGGTRSSAGQWLCRCPGVDRQPDPSPARVDGARPDPIESELWPAIQRARHHLVAPLLAGLGISPKLKTSWGIARVELFGPGRAYHQPAEDGAFALIMAVVEFGDLADLAAIELPSQHTATRLGLGKALGLDDIDRARWDGGRLNLVDKPLEWLREPEGAACIIDWSVADFTLADLEPAKVEVWCSSLALAERVEQVRPRPMPKLLVVT